MYCPVDHYVAGEEKELLLQATDFCLLPSRFEPCGLVDVEFGWVRDEGWVTFAYFVCHVCGSMSYKRAG